MGKRVRGRLDLLSGQTGAVLVLGLAFLLCGLAGIFLTNGLEEAEYIRVRTFLEEAFRLMQEGQAPALRTLLWERICLVLPVLILGTTPLGVPVLPFFFGWLGFRFACPVGCLFRAYGPPALYPAFALFGLSMILWLPLLFWMGSRGFVSARSCLKNGCAGKEETEKSSILFRQTICCVLLFVCVLIEYFAAPALLRAAAQVVL